VQFHPAGEGATRGARADGVCSARWQFRLSTVTANDGVPVGEYTATVTLRRPLFTPEGKPGRNTLPEQYARPTTSPLRAKIVEGKNEVVLGNATIKGGSEEQGARTLRYSEGRARSQPGGSFTIFGWLVPCCVA